MLVKAESAACWIVMLYGVLSTGFRTEVRSKETFVVEKVIGRTKRDCPFWLTIFVGVTVPFTVRVIPTEGVLN